MPLPSNRYSKLKAQTIKIEESITLQKEQERKLKEIQSKHAAERLAACRSNVLSGGSDSLSSSQKMKYRQPKNDSDDEQEETTTNNYNFDVNNDESGGESENEDGVCVKFTQNELDPP